MIISAAARTSDASILMSPFTLRGTFLRHIVTAILGKCRGKAVKQIIIRGLLTKANGFNTEYKRGKRKELVDGFLICSLLPAPASLKLHYVMHERGAANNMT